MISLMLSDIEKIVEGQLIGEDTEIKHVSTDTRTIEQKALFVALVGERFDAHDFADQALEKGAVALLVEKQLPLAVSQIIVQDSKLALGALAAEVNRRCATKTMAITGSCGKTTVKEMVASILSQQGEVLYTAGNFNNDIGVPLTLLRSQPSNDYAVIELGANHQGEIAYTTSLVHPTIALVNNVAEAHLEGFGSLEGVKIAKGEIFQGLAAGDVALVNSDSQGEALWQKVLSDKTVMTFSKDNPDSDFFASDISLSSQGLSTFTLNTPQGKTHISLALVGEHNVANAVAAAALCLQSGIELAQVASGLAQLNKVKGRVELEKLSSNITLIDDSYNASVPAMKAAIDLLSQFEGQRWLVLGNMAELGEESLALHREVGDYAAPFAFEHVLTYGEDARVISDLSSGIHFECHDAMNDYIQTKLTESTNVPHTILVKGANSAGMYYIARVLKENYT